jgi:hypothetical protein
MAAAAAARQVRLRIRIEHGINNNFINFYGC